MELVREGAAWEARAAEAGAQRDILQSPLQAAQSEREAAAADLAQAERRVGKLRDELARARRAAGEE